MRPAPTGQYARPRPRRFDPLASAVNFPPMQGALQWPPETGLHLRPLHQSPGKVAPFDPRPPAVRRTGESVKSPYLPPVMSRTDPPPKPRLLSPGKVPPPRACPRASRLPLGRPLRAPASPPPHPLHLQPAGAPAPRRANWRPPSQGREAREAAPRPGLGEGTASGARLRGDRRAQGHYREGHPARAPTVTSPAIPAPPAARREKLPHSCGPLPPLSPGPLGPGHFYTDSPTPFGV
ncbi:hypothetical protein N7534_012092 [Penicillium rubens]|nr:hypothetical protein N7534_012092 [Penicillium rubens]